MICVSLAESSVTECLRALKGIEFAEIRIDKMSLDVNDLKKIFSSHPRLIATCRPGVMAEATRISLLKEAIGAGAAYIDIEVETSDASKREIVQAARNKGCRVIISYHNLIKTPARCRARTHCRLVLRVGRRYRQGCVPHSHRKRKRPAARASRPGTAPGRGRAWNPGKDYTAGWSVARKSFHLRFP